MAGKIDSRLLGIAGSTTLDTTNAGNRTKSVTSQRAHDLWMKVRKAVGEGRIRQDYKVNAKSASTPASKEEGRASSIMNSHVRKPRPNRLSILLPDKQSNDRKAETPPRHKSPHVVRSEHRSPVLALNEIGLSLEDAN